MLSLEDVVKLIECVLAPSDFVEAAEVFEKAVELWPDAPWDAAVDVVAAQERPEWGVPDTDEYDDFGTIAYFRGAIRGVKSDGGDDPRCLPEAPVYEGAVSTTRIVMYDDDGVVWEEEGDDQSHEGGAGTGSSTLLGFA